MQHDILISVFSDTVLKRKVVLDNIAPEKRKVHIETTFSKDSVFKNQVIGIVIGQFTNEEFDKYTNLSSEINKRILQIVKNRILDNFVK